jgi:hypothetical protein
MEAVGLFLEVRMKNDAVITGEFCVLTCVLTFGLQALSSFALLSFKICCALSKNWVLEALF